MNRKITKFGLLVAACSFLYTTMAQHNIMESGKMQNALAIKKSTQFNWKKSVKEVIFYEDFSDNGFDDWTVVGAGQDNWSSSATSEAGGEAPEALMQSMPFWTDSTSRLVSPVINTSGHTILSLSFLNYQNNPYGGDYIISIETTSDGGITWNQAWEQPTPEDVYWAFEVQSINTPDVGSEDFQFCFRFTTSNSFFLLGWNLDNITLADPLNYDVATTGITGFEGWIAENDEVTISSVINNYGLETSSFDVVLEIFNGTNVVFESTKSVSDLALDDNLIIDFDTWTAVEGDDYTAVVTTILIGDENPDNDQLISEIFIVYPDDMYCIPSADCSSYGHGFTDFAWAGIENYGSGCSDGGYGDFTGLAAAVVEIGSSYTATFGDDFGNQYISIWIDFNQDYEFTDSEKILPDYYKENEGLLEVDINIPGYIMPGTHRMRIGSLNNSPSSLVPCYFGAEFGEYEDYTVVVTSIPTYYDACLVSIDLELLMPPGEITPIATIKNFGVETINFPVTMTVEETGYTSTVNIIDLLAGEEVQVAFDVWNAPTGDYSVEICTSLSGDENPDNDCMNADISIRNFDAGVVSIDMPVVIESGEIIPKASIKNYAFETISFPVTMTIDNGYTSTVNITDLNAGEKVTVEFDIWSDIPGTYYVEVQTELIEDELPDNDILDTYISIVESAPLKIIVGEEATGTWCGFCPRGTVYMDSMAMKYPETWIGIAVHNSDPMTVEEYDSGIASYAFGYPNIVVDRTVGIDPDEIEMYYIERMEKVAPAEIIIENKTFDTITKELSFTLTANFVATVSDYRFNAVLIENNVKGTDPSWEQANYYAGGGIGPMGGFENLPNPVPAEDMIYNHVARVLSGGFNGIEGSLPGTVNAGESYSFDFNLTISDGWDINHLEIIGMLLDNASGEIENGTIDHLISLTSDIEPSINITVYPNPANNLIRISNIEHSNIYLYNINGQLILEKLNVRENCILDVSNLENGTYIIKIVSDKKVSTAKVNILH